MGKTKEMDIVFILDKSGSMSGVESDTIGGYNSYIRANKNNNVKVTTVLFNDSYSIINSRKNIKQVKNMTIEDYKVGGTTALLDAIGKSIDFMEECNPKKVMFVIVRKFDMDRNGGYMDQTTNSKLGFNQKSSLEFINTYYELVDEYKNEVGYYNSCNYYLFKVRD